MGDAKHTPGPWARGWGNFVYREDGSVKDGQSLIATCVPLNGTAEKLQTAFANATLIAAAPDLLAALEAMVETFGWQSPNANAAVDAAIAEAQAAIDKATK